MAFLHSLMDIFIGISRFMGIHQYRIPVNQEDTPDHQLGETTLETFEKGIE